MIRIIPYLFYLWLIGLNQVFLSDLMSIWGVTVNLPVLLVLGVALYKSEVTAAWFGFFAGWLAYVSATAMMPWYALIMAVIGFFGYHVRERLNLDSIYSRLILIFSGALLHNIIVLILSMSDGFFFLLATRAIPGALYTAFMAWLFFLVKEGRVTFQKFKAIF